MISQIYTGVRSITICSLASVTVYKSDVFQVKILGDDAEQVKIDQIRDKLDIEYKGSDGSNFTILNGLSVGGSVSIGNIRQNNNAISGNVIYGADNTTIYTSSGKQVRIVNGELFVNGTRVDSGKSSPEDHKKRSEVEIEIYCPNGLAIDLTLDGIAVFNAEPHFNSARIAIKGSGSAKLQAISSRFNISGTGKVKYKSLGGTLKIKVSGSGDITADGEFDDVEVSVYGSGSIKTSGMVKGDYEVDISGKGDVVHLGEIMGQKNKSILGMGNVSW